MHLARGKNTRQSCAGTSPLPSRGNPARRNERTTERTNEHGRLDVSNIRKKELDERAGSLPHLQVGYCNPAVEKIRDMSPVHNFSKDVAQLLPRRLAPGS